MSQVKVEEQIEPVRGYKSRDSSTMEKREGGCSPSPRSRTRDRVSSTSSKFMKSYGEHSQAEKLMKRLKNINERVMGKMTETVQKFQELLSMEVQFEIKTKSKITNISQIDFEPFLKRKKQELEMKFPTRNEDEIQKLLALELEYKKQKIIKKLNLKH